jgi:hypothetical protein
MKGAMLPWGKRLTVALLVCFLTGATYGQPASETVSAAEAAASLQVDSREEGGLLIAEITSLLEHPYDLVREALTEAESWCDFTPLVFNIKACTYEHRPERTVLTIYIGRKFYQPAAEAIQLSYHFQVPQNSAESAQIILYARRGPHGTRDYRIELEAQPTGDGRTALRFLSSFHPSWRSRLATRFYLSGAGQDKIGFSVERYRDGEPVYVRGIRGIVERNAMRYYLALEVYLDSLHLPGDERFKARLQAWFEATEQYPEQLEEMGKEEYLQGKGKERQTQVRWQERIRKRENIDLN